MGNEWGEGRLTLYIVDMDFNQHNSRIRSNLNPICVCLFSSVFALSSLGAASEYACACACAYTCRMCFIFSLRSSAVWMDQPIQRNPIPKSQVLQETGRDCCAGWDAEQRWRGRKVGRAISLSLSQERGTVDGKKEGRKAGKEHRQRDADC